MNLLSRHFTHYREAGKGRPWFAIGPVLTGRTHPDHDGVRLNVVSGIAASIGQHTFAIHRALR